MGVDNRKLIDNFSGICQVVDTHSLKDALAAARQYAVEGDTVLLSPVVPASICLKLRKPRRTF